MRIAGGGMFWIPSMADLYDPFEDEGDDGSDAEPILRTLSRQVGRPTVSQLCEVLDLLGPNRAYVTVRTPLFDTVMLRYSRFRRLPCTTLDFDIVQISVREEHRDRGHASALFVAFVEAAQCYARTVFLEQCITPESVALGDSLVRRGLAVRIQRPGDDTPSYRSAAPV